MEEEAKASMAKLQQLEAEAVNKDKMLAHLAAEITRKEEEYMKRDKEIKMQKAKEKEKIRNVILNSTKGNRSASDKGSPTALSEH